jgi:glycosyltransferase involved in cell wall biosynthesis
MRMSDSPNPFISVIITAHRRREFLLSAVESALHQTLPRDYYEIIVIKDFEEEELDMFLDNNYVKKILIGECNVGKMLFKAIEESRGKVISFLDDDDMFHSDKLEIVYDTFSKNHDLAYYWNNFSTDNNFSLVGARNGSLIIYNSIKQVLKLGNKGRYNMSSISISRKNISSGERKIFSNIESGQDITLFFLSLFTKGKFAIDTRELTFYRIHSFSSMHSSNTNDFVRQYRSIKFIEDNAIETDLKNEITKVRIRLQLNSIIFGNKADKIEIFGLLRDYARCGLRTKLDLITFFFLILEMLEIDAISYLLRPVVIWNFQRQFYVA